MGETTVLYVLTTLAQSCAALAAFVGAVGVFRLQMLREQRQGAERELRASVQKLVGRFGEDMQRILLGDVFKQIESADQTQPNVIESANAWSSWEAFVPVMHNARTALLVLEAWNLLVIGVALVCFNHVPALAVATSFNYTLIVVATVTVAVPLWCVIVWTRGVEK